MNQQIVTQEHDLAARVRLVKGEAKAHKNPFGGLNFGLLEIGTPIGERPAPLRFRLYSHYKTEPICVYRSPQL